MDATKHKSLICDKTDEIVCLFRNKLAGGKMRKSTTLPLVLFALLLAACNLQTTTVEPPTPTLPTALPVVVLVTQSGAPPIQTVLPSPQPVVTLPTKPASRGILYLWPVSISPEMKFNGARSSSSNGGYMIEFDNTQTGSSIVLRTGTEADRYPYCAGNTNPYQIRGVEGCSSMGTGAGAGLEWRENRIHYSVGGMGNGLETVVQFANSLEVLDYQTWQQKFSNAANVPPAYTRIEFITGTTSNTTAYRKLASGKFDEYMLGAMAGQELTVNIVPYTFTDSENFVLTISGMDGSVLVSEAAQVHLWTGILPATQDYVIRVTNQGNTAQYQLNVNIPWRIKLAAGATSTSLNGKFVTGNSGNEYLLQARAGQTLSVSTTSANNNACLTIVARMMDGSSIPLINAASHPMTSYSAVLPSETGYSQDYSILVSSCPNTPAVDSLYTLSVNVAN